MLYSINHFLIKKGEVMNNSDYSMENGVSRFMYQVYGWMTIGLSVTAGLSYYLSSTPSFVQTIFNHPMLLIGLFIAQLALVISLSAFVMRMSYATALACFLFYASTVSITLTPIFLVYTLGSIYLTFLITAGMFGAMCLYGYFTRADLTSIGSMCTMALFGLILAMLVNIFFKSEAMSYIISAIGVVIFTLLTAYDAQKIKQIAQQLHFRQLAVGHEATQNKIAILGALTLYLDFLNLFLFLLNFMGNKRD